MRGPGLAVGGAAAGLLVVLLLIIGGALGIALLLAMVPPGDSGRVSTSGPGVHCAPEDADTTDGSGAPEAEVPDEYADLVQQASAKASLPPELIAAQIYYESNWDESATSPAGAEGIAQFMPETWEQYGDGGDVNDPEDAIPALGRYMSSVGDQVSDAARSEDHHVRLTLAAYNAGPTPVIEAGDVPDYPETQNYVTNIMAATEGASGSFCSVPQGDIVASSLHMAWDDYRTTDTALGPTDYASNPRHGEDESRPAYVETAEGIHEHITNAFFTDCGTFVSTAVRASGVDPGFALRGTGTIEQYVESSDEWETFNPTNEGELQPGDVMVVTYAGGSQGEAGHTYIYTGPRSETDQEYDRAQGASLGTRPPAGHAVPLTGGRGETPYTAARYIGDNPAGNDGTEDQED